jgi:nucleoside-diphosphate-sugar epimerase
MSRRLAVTGAGGFVGRRLVEVASRAGWDVLGLVRSREEPVRAAGGRAVRSALEPAALAAHFEGCSAIVHLANVGAEREQSFEGVNVEGTRAVIAAAHRAGVRRIVYFSGLGVAHYGRKRHTTNRYFLSKLTAEIELLRSRLEVVLFRPSYVLGPGGELVSELARELRSGTVELIDDGAYRLQPIAVADAAESALAAAGREGDWPVVFDLVGPEAVTYADLADRMAVILGVPPYRTRSVAKDRAEEVAASGGYRGMSPEELDCLLCDEVGPVEPLVELLGRPLAGLDETLSGILRRPAARRGR